MYTQRNPSLTQYIKDNDFYIIHLIRKNFLKTILSRETASVRSMYHASPEDSVKPIKVNLDTKTLMSDLNTINDEVNHNRDEFKESRYIEVYYEDLVENKDEVTKSIFEFLGLSLNGISEMEFPLKKINPDRIEDLIENFDEIERIITQSDFKEMLD
jgi:LPS sulfotransferase NodH